MSDHRPSDHGSADLDKVLVITHQTTKSDEPSEGSLHDPALRLHGEAFLIRRFLNDLKRPIGDISCELFEKALVSSIGIDARYGALQRAELVQQSQRCVPILYRGRSHFQSPQQAQRVYGD